MYIKLKEAGHQYSLRMSKLFKHLHNLLAWFIMCCNEMSLNYTCVQMVAFSFCDVGSLGTIVLIKQ